MSQIFEVNQRVRVRHAPGLDGENEGTVTEVLYDLHSSSLITGYAVRITGLYYSGTNAKRVLKTEVCFIEPADLQPLNDPSS